MTISIDTGIMVTPTQDSLALTQSSNVVSYNDNTPSENIVFPNSKRSLILVEPSTIHVVTAYNLDKETKVKFRKVLRSGGVPASGSNGCCPSITYGNAVRLYSVDVPCWVIDKCNPVFVLFTPGSYEIDVVGNSADVVVTSMQFPYQRVNEFSKCSCADDTPTQPTKPTPIVPPNPPVVIPTPAPKPPLVIKSVAILDSTTHKDVDVAYSTYADFLVYLSSGKVGDVVSTELSDSDLFGTNTTSSNKDITITDIDLARGYIIVSSNYGLLKSSRYILKAKPKLDGGVEVVSAMWMSVEIELPN